MTEEPEAQPPAARTAYEEVKPVPGSSGGTSGVTRLWRRTAGAAAVVAVLVIGNATVNAASASASTRTGANTASAPAADTAAASGGKQAPTDGSEPTGAALHGEFKVINRDGSAQLRRWQSGSVNAIDAISLTVRSADGFDSTYLLGPGVSVTGIGLGDEITVVGAGQAVPAEV